MVSKKEQDWNALAEEFRELANWATTPETAVEVVVEEMDDKPNGLFVKPAISNVSGTFFKAEQLIDFKRCKGLCCYVFSDFDTEREQTITCARIY